MQRIALVVALVAQACGGSQAPAPTSSAAVAPAFPATRWVPARPTYVLAAPTFATAQRGIRDAIDGLGMFVGISAPDVGRMLAGVLAVDPLDEAAVGALGIDVQGGVVAFSEDLAPTFVVRMAAPADMQAFLDRQRARGLVTRSVVVDGIEVSTAEIVRGQLDISWAIADGWMWIHLTPAFARAEGTAWFSHSRAPASADWARDWTWAQQVHGAATDRGLVGFLDAKALLARLAAHAPDAVACTRLLAPVQRAGLSIEVAAGGTARGALALDLGDAAAAVARATLPVPEGFAGLARGAPAAVQWNLDLVALRAWARPCLALAHEDLGVVDRYGVRAGRAVVQRVDLDDKTGVGVVALDLAHRRFASALLDDIPMRSTLERDRRFGPYPGHTIAIPFVATVDYVLTDTLAVVAMGEGTLGALVGSGKTVPGPLAAVDLAPPALSAETWRGLLELADLPASLADRLLRWRDAHVSISIEGSSLVLAASGTRR